MKLTWKWLDLCSHQPSFSFSFSFPIISSFLFFLLLEGKAEENRKRLFIDFRHPLAWWNLRKTARSFPKGSVQMLTSALSKLHRTCVRSHIPFYPLPAPHSTLLNIEMSKFIDSNSFSFLFLQVSWEKKVSIRKLKVSSRPQILRKKVANPF